MMDDLHVPATIGSRSHIGAGTRITGKLHFPGNVELLGYVNGRVDAAAIVIEESGEVEGDLNAPTVIIKGRVNGQIIGGLVHLHATACVTGSILYDRVNVQFGAQFDGGMAHKAASAHQGTADQASGSWVE